MSTGNRSDQVREGMDVLDQNGDKIGKAGETLGSGRYFNVDSGFLGTREYYVPFEAVTDVRDDAVYLNVVKDRLDDMGWDRRPEEQTARGAEMTGANMRGANVSDTERRTMQLREEELQTRKEQVETGRVSVGKEVVEEQRTLEVPVTREEVTVERRPVERRPAEGEIGTAEETIRVPVREERVEVEKQAVVYEEVGIGKRQVSETQQVSDTVRREEAHLEKQGDVTVRGWDEAMPGYRRQWQQQYGSAGGSWEEDEPAYRYGHELRSRPEYQGRRWDDVEPQLRRDWEGRNPNKPWDRARDRIRETWDETTS